MRKIWIGIGFALMMGVGIKANQVCQLKKVYHHRVPAQEHAVTSSLGNIVFYCTKYPEIKKETVKLENNKEKVIFFLKDLALTDEVKAMIASFNAINTSFYTARLAMDEKKAGIELIIEYDPAFVAFSYDLYETITKDKGIIFWFYNQKLIKELNTKEIRILKSVHTNKPTIIIDCGHGGVDAGAQSAQGITEKNVVLAIGKNLEQRLKKAGFMVCMIRSDDTFIALDERTYKANNCPQPSLFISLHANSAPSLRASGIESFCLDRSLFTPGIRLETAIDIMVTPIQNERYCKSELLAGELQKSVLRVVQETFGPIPDRKVKHAVSQVLVGTIMPATLIELGFLSHPKESQRLNNSYYQEVLAQGIEQGIYQFLQKTNS